MNFLSLYSRTNLFCFTALWLIAAIGLLLMPFDTVVPIVWNPFAGEPLVFGPGWLSVLVLPVLAFIAIVILSVSTQANSKKDFDSSRDVFRVMINSLLCIFIVLDCTFILIGHGADIDIYPKIAALMFGGLLVSFGNIMPKSQPNKNIGIVLPRVVQDPDAWRIIHRWIGRLTIIAGLSLIVLTLTVLHGAEIFVGVFSAAAVPIIFGVTLSYIVSHKH